MEISTPAATSIQKGPQPTAPEADTLNEIELSPASDSSSVSSVNPDMLGDEIIVGTHVNGHKHARSDGGDEEMAETDNDDKPVSHYPKRKRSTIYNDLGEDKMEVDALKDGDDNGSLPPTQKRHGSAHVKGITLGYWRDSHVPDERGKHAVIGFMDVRDRLRTRIQCHTRTGDAINTRIYPIPPGPGGSWVTFERVVFEDHLVGLNHHEVKEYVKILSDTEKGDESPDVKEAQLAAVDEAKRRLVANPPTEVNLQPCTAWGKDLPEHLQSSRPEKRRRTNGTGPTGHSGSTTPHPQQVPPPLPQHQQPRGVSPLHGKRPTRILLGCWTKSNSSADSEKHAVFGVLGANDMFRVKLMRETMDGRPHNDGNFPTGAGALWINYEEVKFLAHLQNLTRPEMKEYVRVRQSQIDAGETDETRIANETQAVYEAQRRASAIAKHVAVNNSTPRHSISSLDREGKPETPKPELRSQEVGGQETRAQEIRVHDARAQEAGAQEIRGQEPQDERRVVPQPDGRSSRHALPEAGRRLDSRSSSIDHERERTLVSRTIDRMELNQVRDDRFATRRAAALNTVPSHEIRRDFNDHLQRMDKVWQAQEISRQGPNNDNVKIHAGIKYERKRGGPFEGKLVSQGTIISIDGEDYVEYRVLTKPSFF
ncbi:hypothetical protein SLS62_002847 [Diatrype stigma]|uniref:Uncharacterized protein n=1 Tax=Diatrype stigma TaxID=117547 RepID=A0AAN9V7N3_9PEZI